MELTKLSEVTQLTVPEVVHALALVLSVSVEADGRRWLIELTLRADSS